MSAPLRLSHNELSGLLKYMFQGVFGHAYDWGALAEHIVWLETHGYGGLAMLMDVIDEQGLSGFSGTVSETPNGYEIDFKGQSLLLGLTVITDLAQDYTRANKKCIIDIISAGQTGALIAAEMTLHQLGLSARASLDTGRLSCSSSLEKGEPQRSYSAAERIYDQNLRDGIVVDRHCYDTLNKIADRTLVEASEASRKGAGE